ncbi:hypothetical protein CMV_018406 [Castanea mollissima]|uniref:Uncharacterized protein n=1 Tax=Castanea mollissima TaxID=60419 RepID=A0A8J4VNR7_9ROSI|nr:hypothetical protein CMV_018406 [Castanea mollissima]
MVPTSTTADSLTNDISEELIIDIPPQESEPVPKLTAERCIYRVPQILRQVNIGAYTPKVISIGPFHHGKEELRDMEMLKLIYYKEFCQRTETKQQDIGRVVANRELEILHCYELSIGFNSEDFMKMVEVDSIFIIEHFFRATAEGENENNNMGRADDTFFNLACKYCWKYLFSHEKQKLPEKEVKHFTDLIRYIYYPSKPETICKEPVSYVYSATKLYETGVRFEKIEEVSFDKIKFKKWEPLGKCQCFSWLLIFLPCLKYFPCMEPMQSLLYLPSFVANNRTEDLFRNIMALEQYHYPSEAYLCNYMVLLDHLINTSEDVELLVDKGIIVNALGSYQEIANMVNRIALEIVEENSCYSDVAKKLRNHYQNGCNRNIGYLKTNETTPRQSSHVTLTASSASSHHSSASSLPSRRTSTTATQIAGAEGFRRSSRRALCFLLWGCAVLCLPKPPPHHTPELSSTEFAGAVRRAWKQTRAAVNHDPKRLLQKLLQLKVYLLLEMYRYLTQDSGPNVATVQLVVILLVQKL